jgi:signal transduction histidine kinase
MIISQATSYQAWCLRALLPIVGGIISWLFIRFRIRTALQELQGRLAERLDERERIARELHDTLLQGLFGLTLSLQFSVNQLADGDPLRDEITKALDRSDSMMRDGRERIMNLRARHSKSLCLPQALDVFGQHLQSFSSVQFHVSVDGSQRSLNPFVQEEITFICKEALSNAFRHSNASAILVGVAYHQGMLDIRIQDNGIGMEKTLLLAGGRENHWGLASMRERAKKMRGELTLQNTSEGGTEVYLRVPASIAYRSDERAHNPSRFHFGKQMQGDAVHFQSLHDGVGDVGAISPLVSHLYERRSA